MIAESEMLLVERGPSSLAYWSRELSWKMTTIYERERGREGERERVREIKAIIIRLSSYMYMYLLHTCIIMYTQLGS